MKKIIILIFSFILLFTGVSCKPEKKYKAYIDDEHCVAIIDVKSYGEIVFQLDKDNAPLTVEHFKSFANDKAYDGTYFNRYQAGFVLQGGEGCTETSTVKGEFMANGVNNKITHTKGVISMARSNSYDSASSQFFIVLDDAAAYSLDGQYAGFGKIIKGMDVVNKIINGVSDNDFRDDYYGQSMGFLKENSFIKIKTIRVYD